MTSSGHSFFSDYETDNDSSTITGASSSTLGAAVSTSNYSNHLTAAPVIQSWGTTTLGSSTTESMTLGANGMVTAGTTTEAGSSTQTSTYTLSEVQTTTESVSTSSTDSAAGNTDNLLGRTTLTGTMTDTITDPLTTSTLTDTNSSTVTVGVSDVVSGGSLTDSLYQTGNNLTTDHGTGTLSSTETSTLTATNSGQSTSGATTITDTLTDNSVASSGSPTTLTQTETMTLGSNAVISSGQQATTLIGTGWGTDSLYQVVNESFSTGSGSNQGGSMNLNANVAHLGFRGEHTDRHGHRHADDYSDRHGGSRLQRHDLQRLGQRLALRDGQRQHHRSFQRHPGAPVRLLRAGEPVLDLHHQLLGYRLADRLVHRKPE